jgi:hypothetical protein
MSAAFCSSNWRVSHTSAANRSRNDAEPGEGVQNVQLAGRMQERLMLVRPVHIDQFLAQRGEHLERGGGTVDELAIGPGSGEGRV